MIIAPRLVPELVSERGLGEALLSDLHRNMCEHLFAHLHQVAAFKHERSVDRPEGFCPVSRNHVTKFKKLVGPNPILLWDRQKLVELWVFLGILTSSETKRGPPALR